MKLPPIIFIHGLNSNSDNLGRNNQFNEYTIWLDQWRRFDYCLNYDGDYGTANTNFWPTAGADMAVFSGTWLAGDYYFVNFDVGSDGSFNPDSAGSPYNVESNQSAIVKQGVSS